MRKIKFRGRTFNGTIWAYGLIDMLRFDDDTWHYYIREYKQNGGYTDYEVDHNTIGQFTGLYDKNGKEIYEDDIVQCGRFIYRVQYDANRIASFYISRDGDFYNHYFGEAMLAEECEVIGNIHDNKELLTQTIKQ